MRLTKIKAAILLAALCAAGAQAAAAKPLKDLTREADMVFRGTVVRPGAANLEIVVPDAKTAIVGVDEVLKAGAALDDFTGREVTVFLAARALQAGDQRVFFTRVGLIGESLGVQEIGRLPGRTKSAKSQVAAAERQIQAETLAARIDASDLAIDGRVLSVRATYTEPKRGVLSEHDPLWWEAVLEVRAVLHGQLLEATVPVWFPNSIDAMWAEVPKPDVGRQGIWLLHRYVTEEGRAIFALLSREDLLTSSEASLVERSVKP